MHPKIILIVTLIACTFAACKKNSDKTPNGASNKVKLYIQDARNTPLNTIDSFAMTYDNSNRLISQVSSKEKFVYTYSGNTSFTMDLYELGQLSIHEIGYVGSNNFLDSTFQFNDTQDSSTEKYFYNGTLLTNKISYDYSNHLSTVNMRESFTYDNNGNLIKDVQTAVGPGVSTTTTFTYTDKPIQFALSPSFVPVQAKNLPATQSQTDPAGNKIATVTYSYEFDSQGRITKETDAISGGYTVIKTYVYY